MSCVGLELISSGFMDLLFITLLETPELCLGLRGKEEISALLLFYLHLYSGSHVGRRTAETLPWPNAGAQIWKAFLG